MMIEQHPAIKKENGKGETAIYKPTKHTQIKRIIARRMATYEEPEEERDPDAPPIGWAAVDASRPAVKLVASGLGWFNSAATNCVTMIELCYWVWYRKHPAAGAAPASLIALGMVLGLLMFGGLTLGQIYTIGRPRWRWAYRVCLCPDVFMTALQWAKRVTIPLLMLFVAEPAGFAVLCIVFGLGSAASSAIGLLSAKIPEWLAFGPRHPMPEPYA